MYSLLNTEEALPMKRARTAEQTIGAAGQSWDQLADAGMGDTDAAMGDTDAAMGDAGNAARPKAHTGVSSPDGPWTADDGYRAVELWYQKYGPLSHQFLPYENFVHERIRNIIDEEPDIMAGEHHVSFSNVQVRPPGIAISPGVEQPMYPSYASLHGISYEFTVSVDVTINKKETFSMDICTLPAMVNSSVCNLHSMSDAERVALGQISGDPGGYFITNGVERCLIGQIRRAYNHAVVMVKNDRWSCDMRSMNDETAKSSPIVVTMNLGTSTPMVGTANNRTYTASSVFDRLGVVADIEKYIGDDLPEVAAAIRAGTACDAGMSKLAAAARAAVAAGWRRARLGTLVKQALANGARPDAAIVDLVAEEALRLAEQGRAQEDIMATINSAAANAIVDDAAAIFPHIGIKGGDEARAVCLGRMVRKLVMAQRGRLIEDRADYAAKRIEPSGHLLAGLFKMMWKQFLTDVHKRVVDHKIPVKSAIETRKGEIARTIQGCFSKGVWGAKNSDFKRLGVVNLISSPRLGIHAQLSALRRVKIYMNKDNKNRKVRQMHASPTYFLCLADTVEGAEVGTRLSLAFTASLSVGAHTILVREAISAALPMLTDRAPGTRFSDSFAVCVNGGLLGFLPTDDFAAGMYALEGMRRSGGVLPPEVSIELDLMLHTITLWCDAGRLIRPVFDMAAATPERVRAAATVDELEAQGVLVTRDVAEINQAVVGSWPNEALLEGMRYAELHPACLYGMLAGNIVFSNHTQSPRVCYMTCMVRQSIGATPMLGYHPSANVTNMYYAQRPIHTTRLAEISGCNEYPNGVNAIVAIAAMGFNQEDSVIINRAAVERHLFDSYLTKVVTTDIYLGKTVEETVANPLLVYRDREKQTPIRHRYPEEKYSILDADGLPIVGKYVEKGVVLVGKVIRQRNDALSYEDTSQLTRALEHGRVKQVIRGQNFIKVVLMEDLPLEIGDKVCSGMAQKGTCGMIMNEEDMPLVGASGMIPDIIINPHCMPSRMTLNQMLESMKGKVAAASGQLQDGSPFQDSVFENAERALEAHGFDRAGTELMLNGETGEAYEVNLFIGPVYYSRLVQLVSHKMFASVSNSVKSRLTHQPLSGRNNEGGLRVGEMEKDNLLRHGVVRMQRERMLDLSDDFTRNICRNCKTDSHVYLHEDGVFRCRRAQCESLDVRSVRGPYAAKLLFQYIESIGIGVDIEV